MSLEEIEREIDDLGLRDEVEAAAAEYAALQQPVYWPGLGEISLLAAQMLSAPSLRIGSPAGKCYTVGESLVHVKPDCRCPKRRR